MSQDAESGRGTEAIRRRVVRAPIAFVLAHRRTLALVLCLLLCTSWGRSYYRTHWPSREPEQAQAQEGPVDAPEAPAAPDHPMRPAVEWARQVREYIEKNIRDYSATMVKSERIGDKTYSQTLFVKVRHKPLSIYVYSLEPESCKGDEGIYVEGKYDNCLVGHTITFPGRYLGTVRLNPAGPVAMQDQHYPITNLGILNLCRRIIEFAEQDMRYQECEVRYLPGAKVNDRPCTCIEVVHPERRKYFRFHVARIFIDDELHLPIRYEAYDWPKGEGQDAELIEQYTYLNLKVNRGYGDSDFDPRNPNYGYPK